MNIFRTIIGLLLLMGASGLLGCASTPKVASMIPQDEHLVFNSTGKTLAVGTVEGGMESDAMSGSRING